MSPLKQEIMAQIAQDGPMSVEHYMQLCLQHPRYGYYTTRDPFGAKGDFVTAPDISQMFGELLGAWAGYYWRLLGAFSPARVIELGPGRGTLLADFCRAARAVPAFAENLTLNLVETSPTLRAAQRKTLENFSSQTQWFDRFSQTPQTPALILANEFFDALPIRQYQRLEGAWRERRVGLKDGALTFGVDRQSNAAIETQAREGAIYETSPATTRLMIEIGARIARLGGAALIIDYGYARAQRQDAGETLQALQNHHFVDPLQNPGEADLTAHVDFTSVSRAAEAAGAAVYGPISQGTFLKRLGLLERAQILAQAAPSQAEGIDAAVKRLSAQENPCDMGALFKVLCVTRRQAPPPPGFEPEISS